jgi:hypothetical protein
LLPAAGSTLDSGHLPPGWGLYLSSFN